MELTLKELELLHELVDRHISRNEYIGLPWPDVQDLRVKIEGEISPRLYIMGEGYKVIAKVGDVNIVSHVRGEE